MSHALLCSNFVIVSLCYTLFCVFLYEVFYYKHMCLYNVCLFSKLLVYFFTYLITYLL